MNIFVNVFDIYACVCVCVHACVHARMHLTFGHPFSPQRFSCDTFILCEYFLWYTDFIEICEIFYFIFYLCFALFLHFTSLLHRNKRTHYLHDGQHGLPMDVDNV